MTSSDLKWTETKTSETNCIKWNQVKPIQTKWNQLTTCAIKWARAKSSETKSHKRTQVTSSEITWNALKPSWIQWKLIGITWKQMQSSDIKLNRTGWHDRKWNQMVRSEINWRDTASDALKLNHVKSCEIKRTQPNPTETYELEGSQLTQVRTSEIKWTLVNTS